MPTRTENMPEIEESRSNAVPLSIKIICSIFMWLPLIVSFATLWHYPNFTIYYNVCLSGYILVSTSLVNANFFMIFRKLRKTVLQVSNSRQCIPTIRENFADSNHQKENGWAGNILHIVIIPVYHEHPTIVENTIKILSTQNVQMIVGLALEERDHNSDTKYDHIIRKFEDRFIEIIKTIHPSGRKNEIQGRGANCNYCSRYLVKYYEETNLKTLYPYAMITTCDADTTWCGRYFQHFNYLCDRNQRKNFNSVVYSPCITSLKLFDSYNMFTNWISMLRLWYLVGHMRPLGIIRCIANASHVPVDLLKNIDFFDTDNNCDDARMSNKFAILKGNSVTLKQINLPCDNQTPSGESMYQSFVLLWEQNVRWNSAISEIYYLVHQLVLNILKIKPHKNFDTCSWKILLKIIDYYDNLFFYAMSLSSNSLFWAIYLRFSNHISQNSALYYLLIYIIPMAMVIQATVTVLFAIWMFTMNDENTKGTPYRKAKQTVFIIGAIIVPYVLVVYQAVCVAFAWVSTLKTVNAHGKPAAKLGVLPTRFVLTKDNDDSK